MYTKNISIPQYKRIPNQHEKELSITTIECVLSFHDKHKKCIPLKLKDKEFIICEKIFNNYPNIYRRILITNYGKVFYDGRDCYYNGHQKQMVFSLDEDINCKIPLDYIDVLQWGFSGYDGSYISLDQIKENLYSRKFLPVFAKDIEEEGKKLIAEREKFNKEYNDFLDERKSLDKEKEEFVDFQKHLDQLKKDREELDIKKQKLISIKKTIDIDRQMLIKEKEKFEYERKKVATIDELLDL